MASKNQILSERTSADDEQTSVRSRKHDDLTNMCSKYAQRVESLERDALVRETRLREVERAFDIVSEALTDAKRENEQHLQSTLSQGMTANLGQPTRYDASDFQVADNSPANNLQTPRKQTPLHQNGYADLAYDRNDPVIHSTSNSPVLRNSPSGQRLTKTSSSSLHPRFLQSNGFSNAEEFRATSIDQYPADEMKESTIGEEPTTSNSNAGAGRNRRRPTGHRPASVSAPVLRTTTAQQPSTKVAPLKQPYAASTHHQHHNNVHHADKPHQKRSPPSSDINRRHIDTSSHPGDNVLGSSKMYPEFRSDFTYSHPEPTSHSRYQDKAAMQYSDPIEDGRVNFNNSYDPATDDSDGPTTRTHQHQQRAQQFSRRPSARLHKRYPDSTTSTAANTAEVRLESRGSQPPATKQSLSNNANGFTSTSKARLVRYEAQRLNRESTFNEDPDRRTSLAAFNLRDSVRRESMPVYSNHNQQQQHHHQYQNTSNTTDKIYDHLTADTAANGDRITTGPLPSRASTATSTAKPSSSHQQPLTQIVAASRRGGDVQPRNSHRLKESHSTHRDLGIYAAHSNGINTASGDVPSSRHQYNNNGYFKSGEVVTSTPIRDGL